MEQNQKNLFKLHEEFCDYAEFERVLSKRTIRWYKESFKEFSDFLRVKLFIAPELNNLTHLNIRLWLREGTKRGNKPNTVYNRYKGLKSFCTYLVKEEIIEANPYDKVEKPKLEKTIPVWLDEEEARSLLRFVCSEDYFPKHRQKRDVAILAIFLFCALRKSELFDLKEEDINFDDRKLKVVQGKGGKDRIIHMTEFVTNAIKDYLKIKVQQKKPRDYLFYSYNKSNRISTEGLKYLLDHLRQQAGIKKHFTAHTLRHTAASLILKGSHDILAVKKILGHEKIETTMQYVHANDEQVSCAMEKHVLSW